MNNQQKNAPKADETHGAEIERTSEMYEKGGPAPGTKHAGEEGKEYIAHQEPSEEENNNVEAEDAGT